MITIIDYNAGNVKSVCNALERLGVRYEVTSDPKKVAQASKIIMPGVGNAQAAMEELEKRGLVDVIQQCRVPFLGICLGMQVLFEWSDEGDTECLGILKGRVQKFKGEGLRVPQMGWNCIQAQSSKLKTQNYNSKLKTGGARSIFESIADSSYFYFIHSYYCIPEDKSEVIAVANYGSGFCAAVQWRNFYGVQFHPEKSGEIGLLMLKNFCYLRR